MRSPVIVVAAIAAMFAVACSDETPSGGGAAAPASATPAADARVAKIPILPGYKYYAGGPVMKRDQYGASRLLRFNGEVAQPPSRGVIFGAKQEGDKLEYRVWANGRLVALHRGHFRDGLFWQDYAESYRDEKLIARENRVHEDQARRSKLVTEDIDPENGEVIRTKEGYLSYLPPAVKDDDEEAEEDGATAPAAPAAPTPAPAPAPPAGH